MANATFCEGWLEAQHGKGGHGLFQYFGMSGCRGRGSAGRTAVPSISTDAILSFRSTMMRWAVFSPMPFTVLSSLSLPELMTLTRILPV